MSTDGAYADALRAHMLGQATAEQRELLEAVRVAAGYPHGRYPLPPADPDGPVYTRADGSGVADPTGRDVEDRAPRRSCVDQSLSDEVAECGHQPSRAVHDR